MLTPLLLCLYDYLQRTGKILPHRFARSLDESDTDVKPDVIVCGFGRVGQIVCQMLDSQSIPYVAIDMDVSSVMMGREMGFNVVYGDATNRDVMTGVGLSRRVRSVVIALDNASTARHAIATIKSVTPRVKIFARARNLADAQIFLSDGVDVSLPETIESSFLLGASVLECIGVRESSVNRLLSDMRSDNYSGLATVISDKQD
jgi:voltage-gated potassium channel Kch